MPEYVKNDIKVFLLTLKMAKFGQILVKTAIN